jgi:hypothetical protein
MLVSDGWVSDQVDVGGSNSQMQPFSSTGAMASPPRPEKRYIFPLRAVEAEPTRGEGDWDVAELTERIASVN